MANYDLLTHHLINVRLSALDEGPLTLAQSVKNLGVTVILNASLNMEGQVTNIAKLAFFHLWQAKKPPPFLRCPDIAMVIHVTVISSLNYWKLIYTGLPLILTQKFQWIQNAAAQFLTGTS